MNEFYYFFVHIRKFDMRIAKITHHIHAPRSHMQGQDTDK